MKETTTELLVREQFEEWFALHCSSFPISVENYPDSGYVEYDGYHKEYQHKYDKEYNRQLESLNLLWSGWQGRGTVGIELPASSEIAVSQDQAHLTAVDYTLEKCKQSLKSAGYRVKESSR